MEYLLSKVMRYNIWQVGSKSVKIDLVKIYMNKDARQPENECIEFLSACCDESILHVRNSSEV